MIDNASTLAKYKPHQLYSLADMIEFIGNDFLGVMYGLRREVEKLNGQAHEGVATAEERKHLEVLLDGDVAKLCQQLELSISEDRCCDLANKVLMCPGAPDLPRHEIKTDLLGLLNSISREVAYTQFVYISKPNAEFCEQDALFGEEFHKNASAEINSEIKAAGNCIAVDLHTAAVFHLMRVAEYGLRALANHLQVAIAPDDLEYKEWNAIIDQIEVTLKERGRSPQGTAKIKAEERELYSGLATDLRGFKDVFRNSVMHTRDTYKASEAEGVYDRVRDFMVRLASRVSLT
jgi:hypothetical protein